MSAGLFLLISTIIQLLPGLIFPNESWHVYPTSKSPRGPEQEKCLVSQHSRQKVKSDQLVLVKWKSKSKTEISLIGGFLRRDPHPWSQQKAQWHLPGFYSSYVSCAHRHLLPWPLMTKPSLQKLSFESLCQESLALVLSGWDGFDWNRKPLRCSLLTTAR